MSDKNAVYSSDYHIVSTEGIFVSKVRINSVSFLKKRKQSADRSNEIWVAQIILASQKVS